MGEVVYTAERVLPSLYFVGKKMDEKDGLGNKSTIAFRDEVIESKQLEILKELEGNFDDSLTCLMINEEDFSYWVGYFFEKSSNIPDGFDYMELPKSRVVVTWLKGKQSTSDLYGQDAIAQSLLALKNADIIKDVNFDRVHYYYERYDNRRFNFSNDETILDYGFYIQ
ncbi:hypothetical protein [Mycoplasma sp. P36-A1]|uniref:hypothetical protein n=1 Tax=Mycoplasma sp. P36-A1 TaxID=3252900 RepID=UPI003C2F1940